MYIYMYIFIYIYLFIYVFIYHLDQQVDGKLMLDHQRRLERAHSDEEGAHQQAVGERATNLGDGGLTLADLEGGEVKCALQLLIHRYG